MYKKLHNHLLQTTYYIWNDLTFKRVIQKNTLIDQINSSFEKSHFTLDVFIDLSKAFDTVDHHILVPKLENYGVNGKNLSWFQSYLKIRKQHLNFNNKLNTSSQITCSVPQGSIHPLQCSSRIQTFSTPIKILTNSLQKLMKN